MNTTPPKTKLYKNDITKHKQSLRRIGILGVLDLQRHLRRFVRTFAKAEKKE